MQLLLLLLLLQQLLLASVFAREHGSSFLLLSLVCRDEFANGFDVSRDSAPVVVRAGSVGLPCHAFSFE
jgi:hypothetical protein